MSKKAEITVLLPVLFLILPACDSNPPSVAAPSPASRVKSPAPIVSKATQPKAQKSLTDPQDFLTQMEIAKRDLSGNALLIKTQELYFQFIESNPIEDSLELLLNADINLARSGGFGRLFLLIAEKNPILGIDWISKNEKELFNPEIAIQFGRNIAEHYPGELKIYLAKLDAYPEGNLGIRTGMLQSAATTYSEKSGNSFEELFPFIAKNEGEQKALDIKVIVSGLQNSKDPSALQEAVKFINEIKDPQERNLEKFQLLSGWAEKNGAEAATFAQSLEGDLRKNGFQEVFSVWARQNPKEAGLALLAMPTRNDRLAALKGYLPVLSALSPQEAKEFKALATKDN